MQRCTFQPLRGFHLPLVLPILKAVSTQARRRTPTPTAMCCKSTQKNISANGESAKFWFKNIDRNVGCVNFALCISLDVFQFFTCDLQGSGGMLGKSSSPQWHNTLWSQVSHLCSRNCRTFFRPDDGYPQKKMVTLSQKAVCQAASCCTPPGASCLGHVWPNAPGIKNCKMNPVE